MHATCLCPSDVGCAGLSFVHLHAQEGFALLWNGPYSDSNLVPPGCSACAVTAEPGMDMVSPPPAAPPSMTK